MLCSASEWATGDPGRCFRIGGGRQDVVFDLDQRRRVFGDVPVVGNNDGDRLSDMADFFTGEDRPVPKLFVGLARHPDRKPVGCQMRRQICHCENRVHTRLRARSGGGDPQDSRMRQRASDECCLQHVGKMNIVGIPAAPGEKGRVFDTADRLSEGARNSGSVEGRVIGQFNIPFDAAI